MNNKVIEVLDYIGEKLGIAVDWTADNVWPQVIDILGRYRILQIVTSCLWLVVMLGVLVVFIKLWKRSIKARKTCIDEGKDNFWWDYRRYNDSAEVSGTFGLIVASIFCGTSVVIGLPFVISNILKWTLVPEIQFLELFSEYLK